MIDTVLARENLTLAWETVRAKKGGAGVDGVTLNRWGRNWEANIETLRHQVKTNTYRPSPPKRYHVPKKDGGRRELCLLTITDKVLQRALLNVIDPVFDPRFLGCCHGYRKGHSVATAVQQVLAYRDKGLVWVLDADIKTCFDSLDHGLLMRYVQRVVKDWFVLNLMQEWLKVSRKNIHRPTGIPAGAVISPLWANVYLHQLDARLSCAGWKLVRYADDFVVMVENRDRAVVAKLAVQEVLSKLKLQLSSMKTQIVSFKDGLKFLGVQFGEDAYQYTHGDKKVKVKGKNLDMLFRYQPIHYEGVW